MNWKKLLMYGTVAAPVIGAGFYTASLVTKDLQVQALRDSADPSKLLLDKLAGQEQFKTDEGKKQLDAIRGDTQFTTALNKAIKNDPSVAKGIVDLTSSSGGDGMDGKTFAEKLTKPRDRKLFTNMLNKVAEKPDDEFDFKWMQEVGDSAAKKDHTKTKQLLAKGGIEDKRLELGIMFQDMAKNPMMIWQMLKNPGQFFATLMSAIDFEGPAQAGIAKSFFRGVEAVISALTPTSPEAKRVIAAGKQTWNDATGETDRETQRRLAGDGNNVTRPGTTQPFTAAANGQTPGATPGLNVVGLPPPAMTIVPS